MPLHRSTRFFTSAWLWLAAWPVLAQSLPETINSNLLDTAVKSGLTASGNSDNRSVFDLFGVYLSIALGFVGITFTVQIVHGGYLWMTAGGNEEQVKKAQSKIANGAAGAAIVFFAYLITAFILYMITDWGGIQGGF